jgi:MFS family permease
MVVQLSTSPTVLDIFRNTKLVIYNMLKVNNKANVEQFLTLAQNIGLLFGAVFWGFGCDIFGRRWAFNLTIGITAVFGMIAASSPNFAAIGVFAALWSVGVGGNLPVDSAIFLEFLPGTHQYLLTILSIDWALAQVFATLVAWPLLGNLTCQSTDTDCTRGENMGWRYFLITMGGVALLMFLIRFLAFTVYESPKFLMGKGRDEEAVRVVHDFITNHRRPPSLRNTSRPRHTRPSTNHDRCSRQAQPAKNRRIAHQSPLRHQETRLFHQSHHHNLGIHRSW